MHDVTTFGSLLLLAGVALLVAVFSNRLTELTRIPAPLFFLALAALAVNITPRISSPPITSVQRIVTVALVLILFDGGMHIGLRRFRESAAPILGLGVIGTFVTAAALAALTHAIFGIGWRESFLIGTALAPTDPAVVFSVLGRREISGRSGVLLQGESGANDPVGIALLASLLTAGSAGGAHLVGDLAVEFTIEMVVGSAVGVVGGLALVQLMRRLPLPNEGLYPLRTLAGALTIYGLAAVAHGSGFLAVLIAGIIVGDVHAPYKGEIRRFHAALASLGEIAAFMVLGLTVDFGSFLKADAWLIGLVLGALLAFVVRPAVLAPLLAATRITNGERLLVAWSGLKGAVPILLGTFLLTGHVFESQRLYDAVIIVVVFSVLVQGSLVPWVAERCNVPMRTVDLEPWALSIRFREQPDNLHRVIVRRGSAAEGSLLADLDLDENVWVAFVVRNSQLIRVGGDTSFAAGDEVVLLLSDSAPDDPSAVFTTPSVVNHNADS